MIPRARAPDRPAGRSRRRVRRLLDPSNYSSRPRAARPVAPTNRPIQRQRRAVAASRADVGVVERPHLGDAAIDARPLIERPGDEARPLAAPLPPAASVSARSRSPSTRAAQAKASSARRCRAADRGARTCRAPRELRVRGRGIAFSQQGRRDRSLTGHAHHVAEGAEQVGAALVPDAGVGHVASRSRDVAKVAERPGLADGVAGLPEQVVCFLERRPGVRIAALPAPDVGEVAECGRHGGAIAKLPADAHALFEPGAGALVVAEDRWLTPRLFNCRPRRAGRRAPGRSTAPPARLRRLEHRRERLPGRWRSTPRGRAASPGSRRSAWKRRSLRGDGLPIPVVGQRQRQAERPFGVIGGDQVIERGAVVLVLALAARQPLVALRGGHRPQPFLGEDEAVGGVGARVTGCSPLASSCSSAYSRTVSSIVKRSSSAPRRLPGSGSCRRATTSRPGPTAGSWRGCTPPRRPQGAEPANTARRRKSASRLGQQLVAPVDRVAQRLLPRAGRGPPPVSSAAAAPGGRASAPARGSGPAPRPARWPAAARRGGRRSPRWRRRSPRSARRPAAVDGLAVKSATAGLRASASSGSSRAMTGTGSGRTGMHCSPDTCRTAWLVTSSVSAGVDSTRPTSAAPRRAAARSCRGPAACARGGWRDVGPQGVVDRSTFDARQAQRLGEGRRDTGGVGERSGAANATPPGNRRRPPSRPAAPADLPLPPGPASVSTRLSRRAGRRGSRPLRRRARSASSRDGQWPAGAARGP